MPRTRTRTAATTAAAATKAKKKTAPKKTAPKKTAPKKTVPKKKATPKTRKKKAAAKPKTTRTTRKRAKRKHDSSDEDEAEEEEEEEGTTATAAAESVSPKKRQRRGRAAKGSSKGKAAAAAVGGGAGGGAGAAAADSDADGGDEGTKSATDIASSLSDKFLVTMPESLVHFFRWLQSLPGKDPCKALEKLTGIVFTGPFDVLAGKFKDKEPRVAYALHWRYYTDPPELQTVARFPGQSLRHWGLLWDDAGAEPVACVNSDSTIGNCFSSCGGNIYSACKALLQVVGSQGSKSKVAKTMASLQAHAKKHGYSSTDYPGAAWKQRSASVNADTISGLGIVVPLDERGVGYRPLPWSVWAWKRKLQDMVDGRANRDDLQFVLANINLATDECDFGMGLQCGLDLWAMGEDFHPDACRLLDIAYNLLQRPVFARLLRLHGTHRQRSNLDQLEDD